MKKKIGTFGAGQLSLGTLVGGQPRTTIFQKLGGGGVRGSRIQGPGPASPPGMPITKIAVLGETSTHNMCTKNACSAPFDFHIWIPSVYVDVHGRALGAKNLGDKHS